MAVSSATVRFSAFPAGSPGPGTTGTRYRLQIRQIMMSKAAGGFAPGANRLAKITGAGERGDGAESAGDLNARSGPGVGPAPRLCFASGTAFETLTWKILNK